MAHDSAADELGRAVQYTYSLDRLLDLTKRLVEEREGITALELYSLYMLSNADDILGALKGIRKIYMQYYEDHGRTPPEFTDVYI